MYSAYFVDDDPLILETFMSSPVFLECGYVNAGHSVNPLDAVGKIKTAQPDAVFTDLKMPEMNGVELMDVLKRAGFGGEFVIISTRVRMEEAARLLKTTHKSVKEISARCGYKDYFYFCRVFKEVYARTPTEYREAEK